jgi:hypothetical protein
MASRTQVYGLLTASIAAVGVGTLLLVRRARPPVHEAAAAEAAQETRAEVQTLVGAPTTTAGQTVAQLLGTVLATRGNVLGAVALGGEIAELANSALRPTTEAMLSEAGLNRGLVNYTRRQEAYDTASARIDDHMLDAMTLAMPNASPLVRQFGIGIAEGVGSIASAPVELAQLLDTGVMHERARYVHGDKVDKAIAVSGLGLANSIWFDGVGMGLVNLIAHTPAQQARGQQVLNALNPSQQVHRIADFLGRLRRPKRVPVVRGVPVRA